MLIGNGSNRTGLTIGYLIGGGVMIIGGLVEVFLAARQGIARVLGTVSQYVLRNAPCPVLTVPEADIDPRGLGTA